MIPASLPERLLIGTCGINRITLFEVRPVRWLSGGGGGGGGGKAFVARLAGMSSIPKTHMVKGEN